MNSILFITGTQGVGKTFLVEKLAKFKMSKGFEDYINIECNEESLIQGLKYAHENICFLLIEDLKEDQIPFLKVLISRKTILLRKAYQNNVRNIPIPDIVVTSNNDLVINAIKERFDLNDKVTTLHLTHINPLNLF